MSPRSDCRARWPHITITALALLLAGAAPTEEPAAAASPTAESARCPHCGMLDCTVGCGQATAAKAPLTDSDPDDSRRCPHCGMLDCTMGCVDSATTEQGDKVMLMAGTPRWLYWAGIVLILIGSFVVLERRSLRAQQAPGPRFDLLRLRALAWWVKRPWFQLSLQLPIFVLFVFLIYAGLAGHGVINITPVVTWTLWWAGLVIVVLFFGKLWCLVCPWDFVAHLTQRLRLWGVNPRPITLGLKWPKWLSNIYLATGLFLVLTWFELGYKVTASPTYTAYMALLMVAFSVVPALLFDKRSYCRHGCLVGRISGLYATFSPVEIRARDLGVCGECSSKACYAGNDRGYACPTGLLLPRVHENTYCIQCTECVRSCPHDNVAINLRPFAEDLRTYRRARRDEALLALIMLSMSAFHGFTMTPLWEDYRAGSWSLIRWIADHFGISALLSFTVGMTVAVVAPVLLFWLMCWVTRAFVRAKDVSVGKIFVNFAYAVLPIALFYHLAHNAMHLFMEGQNVLQVASNPLGRPGVDLFGTASRSFAPILGDIEVWALQTILIVVGHLVGFFIAGIAAKKVFATPRQAMLAHIPMGLVMIASTLVSLWLIHLDMNMRASMM